MSDYDVELGGRIAKARTAVGMSQGDLAESLGCQQSAISHWESGLRAVRAERLARIAQVLQADPGWLLTGRVGQSLTVARLDGFGRDQIECGAAVIRAVAAGLRLVAEERPLKPCSPVLGSPGGREDTEEDEMTEQTATLRAARGAS